MKRPSKIQSALKAPEMKIVEFANSVESDEAAQNELPHLDLHCLPSDLSLHCLLFILFFEL